MKVVALAGWVVVAAGFIACGVMAHVSRGAFPSFADVARHVVRSRAGRWLVLVTWLWTGIHLFVRRG